MKAELQTPYTVRIEKEIMSGEAVTFLLLSDIHWDNPHCRRDLLTEQSNNLYSFIFPNAAPSLYRNDELKTLTNSSNGGWGSTTEPTSLKGIMYNHSNSASFTNGKVQEIIIYISDQTSNRSAINDNINRAYSIY